MTGTRVLIADSHEIVRIGVQSLLTEMGGHQICGEASDGHAAVEKTGHLKPEVVVLELLLPRLGGLEAARQILAQSPHTSVLFFTEIHSERIIRETLRLGIRGFVSKSDRMSDLLNAIEAVRNGGSFFSSHVTSMLLKFAKQSIQPGLLSPREIEIIQLITEGHPTKSIASMLNLSTKTVETHRSNVMRKLGVHSVAELIVCAIRSGIVHIHTSTLPRIGPQRYAVPGFGVGHPEQQRESSLAA